MTATNFTFFKADGTQVTITFAASNVTLNYVGTASGTLTIGNNGGTTAATFSGPIPLAGHALREMESTIRVTLGASMDAEAEQGVSEPTAWTDALAPLRRP